MTASTGAPRPPIARAAIRGKVRRAVGLKRWLGAALAAAIAGSLVGAGSAGPAAADNATTTGSAQSKAAESTPGSGIAINTGSVSVLSGTAVSTALGLLGITSLGTNLTNAIVTPVGNALTALTTTPTSVAGQLASSITNAGLQANSPTNYSQPRPSAGGYPDCTKQGWTSADCYGPITPTLDGGSSLTVASGAAQGYATGDDAGYIAAARVADPGLSLLGVPFGDLGVSTSQASCASTSSSSCQASQTLGSSSSLLGGHLTLSIAQGGSLVASIDGQPVQATPVSVTFGAFTAMVTADGNFATIQVALNTTQLLTALGLPTLLSLLGPNVATVTDTSGLKAATLTLKVGPGNISQTSPASAWGMSVSANLDVDLKLAVSAAGLNLASIEVTNTSSSTPNLLNLKFAYSSATAGTLLPAFVPPGLI